MSDFEPEQKIDIKHRVILEDLCDSYERSWKTGRPLPIHEVANQVPAELRFGLMRELFLIEHRMMLQRKANPVTPNAESNATQLGVNETAKLSSEIPKRVGDYVPQYVLGAGSAGVVYAAIDLKSNEWVALKMPHSFLMTSAEGTKRFLREARNAEGLEHPNIVRFLEVGAGEVGTGDNRPYLVYEFLHGLDLGSYLKHGCKLSMKQSLQLIADTCRGLQYAHDRGVIHRDLKPSNIMVMLSNEEHLLNSSFRVPTDKKLGVKVLDFGIAKVLDSSTVMTVAGEMLGTPAYTSPEQAAGQSIQADQKSDIYSLGVVLYELLTGTTPFSGTPTEVMDRIRREEVPLLAITHPAIPAPVATICNRCLRVDPNRRYSNVAMIVDDIERYLAGKSIQAKPVGVLERSRSYWRRHQLSRIAGSVSVAVLVTVFLFVGVVWPWLDRRYRDSLSTVEKSAIQNWLSNDGAVAHLEMIQQEIPNASARDLVELTKRMEPHRVSVCNSLNSWKLGSEVKSDIAAYTLLSAALSSDTPVDNELSHTIAEWVASKIQRNDAEQWYELIKPVESRISEPLRLICRSEQTQEKRVGQCELLSKIHRNDPDKLRQFVEEAKGDEIGIWSAAIDACPSFDRTLLNVDWNTYEAEHEFARISEAQCVADANRVLVRYHLGEMDPFWDSMTVRRDPRVCTYVVHRFEDTGLPLEKILQRMMEDERADVVFGLMTIIAVADPKKLESLDTKFLPEVQSWVLRSYSENPDAGVHGMCRYLLEKWGLERKRNELDRLLIQRGIHPDRDWFVNSAGMHFSVLRERSTFWMGENPEVRDVIQRVIGRYKSVSPFAISMDEISPEYLMQTRQRSDNERDSFDASPKMSFLDFVRFCNWLNLRENYEPFAIEAEFDDFGDPSSLECYVGYRIATQAEWEFASRAGSATERFHGRIETPFSMRYIAEQNSTFKSPLPNRRGLVNTIGSLNEFTLTRSDARGPDDSYSYFMTKGASSFHANKLRSNTSAGSGSEKMVSESTSTRIVLFRSYQ